MSEKKYWDTRKVAVVGAGAVGSTFCYALAQRGLVDEIVLLDKNRELAEGQALDLAHGLPFFPNVKIYAGDTNDYVNSQIIVITAGGKQSPGENRLNLLKRNAV
jgi:L-lactate dehydrogenase